MAHFNEPRPLENFVSTDKPHKLLREEARIKKWLDGFFITHYKIVPDQDYGFVVNVSRDVRLDSLELTEIPVKFNRVDGGFYITRNRLTSLYGAPDKVGGSFSCDYNNLSSLEYGPQQVFDRYSCYDNKLISLKGSPVSVFSFDCSQNKLTSLIGGPREALNAYYANNNLLVSLNGSPLVVGVAFSIENNKLTSLEGGPEIVGGWYDCSNNDLESFFHFPSLRAESALTRKLNKIEEGEVRPFYCSGNARLGDAQYEESWDELYKFHLIARERVKMEERLPEAEAPRAKKAKIKL